MGSNIQSIRLVYFTFLLGDVPSRACSLLQPWTDHSLTSGIFPHHHLPGNSLYLPSVSDPLFPDLIFLFLCSLPYFVEPGPLVAS